MDIPGPSNNKPSPEGMVDGNESWIGAAVQVGDMVGRGVGVITQGVCVGSGRKAGLQLHRIITPIYIVTSFFSQSDLHKYRQIL